MFIEIHDGILLNPAHIVRISPLATSEGVPQASIKMDDGETIHTLTPMKEIKAQLEGKPRTYGISR